MSRSWWSPCAVEEHEGHELGHQPDQPGWPVLEEVDHAVAVPHAALLLQRGAVRKALDGAALAQQREQALQHPA